MLARSRDQARAAAWPGVITYIIITNKPRPDPPHCLSNSLDHITWPDTAGWPSLMPVTLPPSVGASTVPSPHRRPIISLVTRAEKPQKCLIRGLYCNQSNKQDDMISDRPHNMQILRLWELELLDYI